MALFMHGMKSSRDVPYQLCRQYTLTPPQIAPHARAPPPNPWQPSLSYMTVQQQRKGVDKQLVIMREKRGLDFFFFFFVPENLFFPLSRVRV